MTALRARLERFLAQRQPVREEDPALLRAAVAVIFAPEPDAVLFIRRAERAGDPWSGQMAFPGGRADPGDPDLRATAMREAAEEVGLVLPAESYLGDLDDVAPRSPVLPPLMVRPFVFWLPRHPPLVPNPEVAEVIWAPVATLVRPDIREEFRLELPGRPRVFPAYRLGERVIWGMTERILSPLVEVLVQTPG